MSKGEKDITATKSKDDFQNKKGVGIKPTPLKKLPITSYRARPRTRLRRLTNPAMSFTSAPSNNRA